MNRLFGVMVTRNEAHRYLRHTVAALAGLVDGMLVYDDRSTDRTALDAALAGADHVVLRGQDEPSFAENQRYFRAAAWSALHTTFRPTRQDWAISLDADEFIVARDDTPQRALRATIEQAESESCDSIELPVAECFGERAGEPLLRVDGEWGRIRAARLSRWQRDLKFPTKANSGSIPVTAGPMLRAGGPIILHVGYLNATDRDEKAKRHLAKLEGHSSAHVRSITQAAKLSKGNFEIPAAIRDAVREGAAR